MWNQGYNSYSQPPPAGPPAQQNGYYGAPPPPVSNGYQHAPPPPQHYQQQQHQQQYRQPPQHQQHHQQPGVYPAYQQAGAVDPFRAYYAARLRELTFNSRPIIQDLSLIAQNQRNENNWTNMGAIVEEIEQAVLASGSHEKLPKLYLLDSISKNVGPPYTDQLLPPIIPRLYQRTYREVDGVTKSKMEEMIGLWRTGGPGRSELYGADVREAVERDIFGSSASSAQQQQPVVSQDRVIATMQAALAAHHREVTARPYDTLATQNYQVLQALNQMLMSRPLSPQELQQIMDKLTGMAPKSTPVQSQPQQPFGMSMHSNGSMSPSGPNVPPFPARMPGNDAYRSTPPFQQQPTPVQAYATTPPHPIGTPVLAAPAPLPALPAPAPAVSQPASLGLPIDVANILKSLTGAGLGASAPGTPNTAPVALPRTKLDDYEDMVLALDVKLTEMDLNQQHELPLDHLPERCTQCFMRFTDKGPKFEAHMDWHFRRNKQERQSEGRGSHRRWLPRADEWINDISNAEAGPSTLPGGVTAGKPGTGSSIAAMAGTDGSKPKLSAEQLKKRWVSVPTDPAKKARPCNICQEPFKDEWDENEEIWVWRNALEIDGKYFHATCRAELLENRRLAKLKAGSEPRSMSKSKSPGATPMPDIKPNISTAAATSVPASTDHSTSNGTNGPSGMAQSTTAGRSPPAGWVDAGAEMSSGLLSGGKRKAEDSADTDKKPESGEGDVKRVKVKEEGSDPITTSAHTMLAPPESQAGIVLSSDGIVEAELELGSGSSLDEQSALSARDSAATGTAPGEGAAATAAGAGDNEVPPAQDDQDMADGAA